MNSPKAVHALQATDKGLSTALNGSGQIQPGWRTDQYPVHVNDVYM